MKIQKRKKQASAFDMEQMRILCYDRLMHELLSQNVREGHPVPGERILSERYALPLRVVRATLSLMKEQGILEVIPRKGVRLKALPQLPKSLYGMRFAFIGEIDEDNPRSWLNRPVVICTWMERQINEQGASLEFLNKSRYSEKNLIREVVSGKYQGVFYTGSFDDPSHVLQREIAKARIPCVTIDSKNPYTDNIEFDDEQIGHMMASYVCDCGHRNIAIFHYPQFQWSENRVKACCAELKKRDLSQPKICEFTYNKSLSSPPELSRKLREVSKSCSVIIGANDWLAAWAYTEAKKLGLTIPEDLSIMGADDNHAVRTLNLTTVQMSDIALGVAALERLKTRIMTAIEPSQIETVRVACPLITRSSVRKITHTRNDQLGKPELQEMTF